MKAQPILLGIGSDYEAPVVSAKRLISDFLDKTALLSPVRYSRLSLTYLPILAFLVVRLGRKMRRRGVPR